jgi:NAD(P)-dependent dehydrogenase (short-subunit alcohol dehydrogenase family)
MTEALDAMFSLAGHRALVTGGGSGIGRAMAEALAGAGAEVVVVARTAASLAEVVGAIGTAGGRAGAVAADLSRRDEVDRVVAEVRSTFGEPDILVTAAAVNLRPHLDDLSTADWDATMAVNLDAPFLLGQHLGPRMAERGWGRIINVVSQQAVRAFGNSGAYGVSKAGIAGLTRSQAEAWSGRGVTSNAIGPGFVATPLTAAVSADPATAERLAARTMVGRNGRPGDFAGLVVFLAGPSADYVTGQVVFADGGFSVH